MIGSVLVLEHSSASGLTCGAISAKTFSLSAGSSKTASITRSQPARSAGSAVGGDPAEQLGFFSSVSWPRLIALSSSFSE